MLGAQRKRLRVAAPRRRAQLCALCQCNRGRTCGVGAKVSLAVGTWPEGQCSRANYSACAAAPDTWASECERGAWAVDVCNCCAYAFPFGFFALPDLCGSRAATIVNMDTYQHSPANLTAFDAALAFYLSHGCTSERLAIGLLADEALDALRGGRAH